MAELNRRFSTRSWSTFAVIVMGVFFLLLGTWICTTNLAVGLAFSTLFIAAIISASINWWRAIVSELHINEISISAKHGDSHFLIPRNDVLLVKCNDRTEIEDLYIVLKDGQEIRIPEPCFIKVMPIAVFLRTNWQDVEIELNGKHFEFTPHWWNRWCWVPK